MEFENLKTIKRIVIPLLFALLLLIAFLIRPFISGPTMVEGFCSKTKTGETIQMLRNNADETGISLEFRDSRNITAHYPGAMGRFQCHIQLEKGEVISAEYRAD